MTPRCTVCAHPEAAAIDAAINDDETYAAISERFGLASMTVSRHARLHRGVAAKTGAGRGKRSCTVCSHPEALSMMMAGALHREVAGVVGVSPEMVATCARKHWGMRRSRASCAVCDHPDADRINEALRRRRGRGGWPRGHGKAAIAAAYGFTESVVTHHSHRHLDNAEYEAERATVAVSRLAAVRQYVGAP